MLTKVWSYIKSIGEGADGALSLRRVASIVFLWLVCHLVIRVGAKTQFELYALYSIEVLFLLLIGVITTENILMFFNKNKDDKK